MLTLRGNARRLTFGLGALAITACSNADSDTPSLGMQGPAPVAMPAPAAPSPAASSSMGSAGAAPTAPAPSTPAAGTPAATPPTSTPASMPPAAAPGAIPMGPAGDKPFDPTAYKDPGKGAFVVGTAEECQMDTALFDAAVTDFAVFRYGKLCFEDNGNQAAAQNFSATKTLGGVMAGRASFLAKDVAKTGPGTGPIRFEDLGTDWVANPIYPNEDASIAHIMGMVAAASPNLEDASLVWQYDTVGDQAINDMIPATEKVIAQVPGMPTDAAAFVQQQVFDVLGMPSSTWGGAGIGTGWSSDLMDMGKIGVMLAHDGFYGGEQFMARDWVYRMSHPNFETATTSYGGLVWLNHRGNAEGIGGNIASGANAELGDACAPAAFWPQYPHFTSKAPSCLSAVDGATCTQQFDVGVFSAQGLNGQFIVIHPGLDLVITARNFQNGDGPLGLWRAVRAGIVARDPMFKGDEAAFCAAYGSGNYAPDLPNARQMPAL